MTAHERKICKMVQEDNTVLTTGALTASGSGVAGLKLQANNTITTGVIKFKYDGTPIANGVAQQSQYVLQVPEELAPLVSSKDFINYLTGSFQLNSEAIYHYTPQDIQIEDNGRVIRFDNPQENWLLLAHFYVDISIDLGQAVTDTGIRIADAANASSYSFQSCILEKNAAIDWDTVTETNPSYILPIHQLDPGWELIQHQPEVNAVTDDDTVVTGKGVPGAQIQVKVGDTVIGEGTVETSGLFTVPIPAQVAKTILHISENTGVGWSEAVQTTVLSGKIDFLDTYALDGDGFIRGQYSGDDATHLRIVVDGQAQGTVPVQGNGAFQYWAKNIITSTKQTVSIELLDDAGAVLSTQALEIVESK